MKPLLINWLVEVMAQRHFHDREKEHVRALIADLEMLGVLNPGAIDKTKGDKYATPQQEKKDASRN